MYCDVRVNVGTCLDLHRILEDSSVLFWVLDVFKLGVDVEFGGYHTRTKRVFALLSALLISLRLFVEMRRSHYCKIGVLVTTAYSMPSGLR